MGNCRGGSLIAGGCVCVGMYVDGWRVGWYVEAIGREKPSNVVDIALVATRWDVAAKDVAAVMEEGGNGSGFGNGRDRLSVNTGSLVVGGRAASKLLCTNAIFEAVDETVACGS